MGPIGVTLIVTHKYLRMLSSKELRLCYRVILPCVFFDAVTATLQILLLLVVPLPSGLLGVENMCSRTYMASVLTAGGIALLSIGKGHGTLSSRICDVLEIVTSVFFSFYIIRLGKYCNSVKSSAFVATKIVTKTLLSFLWAVGFEIVTTMQH